MKKWISVILALVTLCTLCTVLPAGAAAPYDGYAYVNENFNDGQVPAGTENALVEPGVGDTGYAVRRNITATSEPLTFPLNLSAVAEGDALKLSAWVRPKTETAFSAVNFKLLGYDENIDLATYTISVPIAGFAQNQWSYVETKIVWENIVMDTGYPLAEIGALLVEAAIPEGVAELTYDIDDIIVEPTQAVMEKEYPNLVQNDMIDGNFDTRNVGFLNSRTAGWWYETSNYAANVKAYDDTTDPRPAGMPETSTKYMNIPVHPADGSGSNNTAAKKGYGFAEFGLDHYGANGAAVYRDLQPGHTYKISFWTRPHANEQGTTTYNPVIIHGVTKMTHDDPNGLKKSTDQEYVMDGITINVGVWNKVEFYLQFDHKTFTSQGTPITFRLKPTNGSINGVYQKVLGGSFDFDEIQILDLGMIANGDFEIGQTANVRYRWAGANANTTQPVLSWTPSNAGATLSQSTVVRPGQTGHSMKVSVTTAGASVYQAVGMENGQKYKISFWAKGENIPAAGLHLMVSMQRSIGSAGANESYDVPNAQYIYGPDPGDIGTAQPGLASRDWTLTTDWQYYEFIYDNTFPLKSGLTQANANTFPRVPWLQMAITKRNDGTGIPAGTAYYLDDFTIEPYDPTAPPVDTRKKEPFCSAIAFSGSATVGQAVGVTSYTYASEKDIPQGTSIMRVLKKVGTDKWAQVAVKSGATPAAFTYTLPADLAGERIRLEFVPMDEENHFGTISAQEYDVLPEVDAIATFSGDGTTTPVSVSVDIANSAAESKNITVILALYDANNTMLDIKSVSVVAANGLTTVPVDPTSTALTAALTPTATTARVFVLDGTSLANAGSVVWKLADAAVPVVPAP